ncbi:MAG: hypothetical protein R2794_12050 [Chitinophagales bacterium]
MRISIWITFGVLLFSNRSNAQLVQLSGIVTDETTMLPVAYTRVGIYGEERAVQAGANGFFSIVANKLDTVEFSALGYKSKYFVVPDTGINTIVSIAVFLRNDTITLDKVTIYPWPSKEEFRDAFLAYQEQQRYVMQPIPGIKGPTEIDTVPKAPNPIMNPISFIYDEVVKPIQWNSKKRDKAKELPQWE